MPASTEPPTVDELIEALASSIPLNDHPTVQRLLAYRAEQREAEKPKLTLIRGGRDA